MPSLSTTSSAHCMCRCSCGSARNRSVPNGMLGPASVEVIVCEPEVAVGVAVPEPATLVAGRGLLDMLSVSQGDFRPGETVVWQ